MQTLLIGWKCRLKLYVEGNRLCAEGIKLYAESNRLCAEGSKLWAESNRLWAEGNKLHVEGNRLWEEGIKLYAEGNRLHVEGSKLYAEGSRLWEEGIKLWAESNRLWAELIIETFGNIKVEWKNWNSDYQSYECHLDNGEIYNFDLEDPKEAAANIKKDTTGKEGKGNA